MRPSSFLRKEGFWKSAVHQLLLNHPIGARAGAAGPKRGFTSPSLGLARPWEAAGEAGLSAWELGEPQTHHLFLCPRTLDWDCGGVGGTRAAFLSRSAKGISLGAPLAGDSPGFGARETMWEPREAQGSLWPGISLPVYLGSPALSLSRSVYLCDCLCLYV